MSSVIFFGLYLTPFNFEGVDNITLTYCLIIRYNHINYSKKRLISNDATQIDIRNLVSDSDFYEWLRGFVDAEACFSIFKQGNYFKFRFQIKLHCDDRPLLEYLGNRLLIGKVYTLDLKSKTDQARWVVVSQKDLSKLIRIFDINPLYTTKYLD